jgi:hypothetical protein
VDAALAGVIALTLGSCSDGQDDVASLGEPSAPAGWSHATQQPALAQTFAACLRDGGLPATTQPVEWDSAQEEVAFATDEPYIMSLDGAFGTLTMVATEQAIAEERVNDDYDRLLLLASKYNPVFLEGIVTADAPGGPPSPEPVAEEPRPFLFIGDADHSPALANCLRQTGYSGPVYPDETTAELQRRQRLAEVGADWADCARQNGYPQVDDPGPASADGPEPAVILPGEITESELAILLAACPAVDQVTRTAYAQAVAALGENPDPAEVDELSREFIADDPIIDFDIAGASQGSDANEENSLRQLRLREMVGRSVTDWITGGDPNAH